jgi:hypothetical protein
VEGSLIFGRDRDRPGVLIDLISDATFDSSDGEQLAQLRDKIWYAYIILWVWAVFKCASKAIYLGGKRYRSGLQQDLQGNDPHDKS